MMRDIALEKSKRHKWIFSTLIGSLPTGGVSEVNKPALSIYHVWISRPITHARKSESLSVKWVKKGNLLILFFVKIV